MPARTHAPPIGAVANALHALTLLIARQLVSELEDLAPEIEYFVVPPLCPLVGSPYDFSRTSDHIERAIQSTDAWLAKGGLREERDSRRNAPAQPLSLRLSDRLAVCKTLRCTAKRADGSWRRTD